MDIDIDLADPNNTLKKLDDGKYIYKSDDEEFDLDKFNLYFDQYIDKRKKEMKKSMFLNLSRLNAQVNEIPIYKESLGQILINTKDTLFNILDDMLQFNFKKDVFTKNNRLFYLGILFLILAIVIYSLHIIATYSSADNKINININKKD